jgi:hypothetical protein
MPVDTRQKCYNVVPAVDQAKCSSTFLRVSVGNCKYRRVCAENIEIIDRGRTQIFSPMNIKDRLRSASRNSFDVIFI